MSGTKVKSSRVLVLGDLPASEDLGRWVQSHANVSHVETFDAALQALRSEQFDVIISSVSDFVPFEELHFTEQAATLLDAVSQGLCIVGESGDLVWANAKMLSFPGEIKDRVSKCALETFNWIRSEGSGRPAQTRERRFSFSTESNEHFELTATPVVDVHECVTQIAVVVWDVTNARRLQAKIDAIDLAGHELVRLDADQVAQLDTQDRLELLEERIMRCTRDLLHFDNFAILIIDQHSEQLDMVLASGVPDESHRLNLMSSSEGSGIAGYVASRGRSYICPDVARDPRYIACVPGAKSSLTVPLRLHDQIIGVANFESTRYAAFCEDDRQFAEIFGRYIAIALHILELLVSERHTTTGRLGSDVMAEITGPLNDILTDIESLKEDYIGHDDLRRRFGAISENVVKVREAIRGLTSDEPRLLGKETTKIENDPILTGKCILIADDQEVIRGTVHDVLCGYGCDVTSVADGQEAVDLVSRQPYDLVLSDIKMPNRSGYDVFAAAKDANPNTAVILMTGFGYDPNHSIIRARREGLSAVLFKPFKVDQLLDEIRMALKPAQT